MVTGTSSVASPAPVTANTNMASSERSVESATPARRASDNRRSNKPIMEKRRRARINNCLNELKALILDAMKKDPARHSKLEKADILEMTVKHLENLQRQQVAMSAASDPAVLNKFRAGFSECAGEVGRFPGLEPTIKRRLLQHLANCLSGANQIKSQDNPISQATVAAAAAAATAVQVHILPSPNTTATTTLDVHNGIIFSNGNGTGVQLVPTRLANGDIALVLPTQGQQATLYRQTSASPVPTNASSPMPMLVPIPTRTASTASASSSTCSSSVSSYDHVSSSAPRETYSAPSSPEPMEASSEQVPLSLVIRKSYEPMDEEKPWRPW